MVKNKYLKKRYPLYLLIFLGVLIALVQYLEILINITPSMPKGVYVKSSSPNFVGKGDIVSICLANPYQSLGLRNHYLDKGRACVDSEPLIKQVIAVPGDNVELTDNHIIVNGIAYPYKTLYFDTHQRPLSVFPRGIYLKTAAYWLIGTHDPKSWDSRYWGPVKKEQIISVVKPILTW